MKQSKIDQVSKAFKFIFSGVIDYYLRLDFTISSRMCMLSHVQLFATPQNVARQAPLSMELSRQEYWSGLPFSSPGESS